MKTTKALAIARSLWSHSAKDGSALSKMMNQAKLFNELEKRGDMQKLKETVKFHEEEIISQWAIIIANVSVKIDRQERGRDDNRK